MIDIAAAGLSDIGRKRPSNQDRYIVDDRHRLYVVADGMGGHQAGEVASQLVTDSLRQYFSSAGTVSPNPDTPPLKDPSLSPEANRMREAIEYANQQVYQAAANDKRCQGMGSTLAAVQFANNTFIAANVGDSPIYLVHEQSIETISVAHTFLAERPDLQTDAANVFSTELQHLLTRGMGVEDTVQPDICESPWYGGDRLVICSDGLSGKVAPEEILTMVSSNSVNSACQLLVEKANQRGGDDNITVIVMHVRKQNKLLQRINQWIGRFIGGGLSEG